MTFERSTTSAPADRMAIENELRSFLEQRLEIPVAADRDLFGDGLVSSMFAMELVVYLEQAFSLAIVGPDLRLDNFRSVATMTELVLKLTSAENGHGR